MHWQYNKKKDVLSLWCSAFYKDSNEVWNLLKVKFKYIQYVFIELIIILTPKVSYHWDLGIFPFCWIFLSWFSFWQWWKHRIYNLYMHIILPWSFTLHDMKVFPCCFINGSKYNLSVTFPKYYMIMNFTVWNSLFALHHL